MVILSVLEQTGPLSNCKLVAVISAAFQAIPTATASYLFLRRVHAVYFGSKGVQYFLWFAVVCASCSLFYDAIHGYQEIADTKYCIRQQDSAVLPIAFGIPLWFDAFVYCTILHKILSVHQQGQKKVWRSFFCPPKGLPRAVFEGGEQYYLITNGVNTTRHSTTKCNGLSSVSKVVD